MKIEKQITELWDDYYHYKYMTANIFSALFMNHGVSFMDFMRWLKSKE